MFEPRVLDAMALGDIDADLPDLTVLADAESLPMHRYDSWLHPMTPPVVFVGEEVRPRGRPLSYIDWGRNVPLSVYTVHLTRRQIDYLWQQCRPDNPVDSMRISKHDAVLAHIWSCIVRARQMGSGEESVYCDFVLSARPAFQLSKDFLGSPTLMTNVAMPAAEVAGKSEPSSLGRVAQSFRKTITMANQRRRLQAHLHGIAFEKSPQRIWQGLLARKHILMTTWARAGLYDVDFGFGSRLGFVDARVPKCDGFLVMKEGPPTDLAPTDAPGDWTRHGVDVGLHLDTEDMDRLLKDPMLFPLV